ncbi:hypothetical protein M9Y10_001048 [Tritrichomonas musculus]|uniref:Eukaryotic translation initiation factor 3 30 kDa subunit n=1 Tax=Tritrichomonas musculus TaxID=1915356 RepID=A0ABR2L6X8_9EUKA
MNWANLDLNSSNSDDQKSDNDGDAGANWGSDDDGLADNWEDAPDPEEVARKKKEEEERIEREKKEAAEAEKKRKQEIREEKIRKKKLLDEAANDFDDDLFDVDVTKEQKEIADLHNALDALGGLDMNTTDPNKIDIGLYKPETVVQFGAFAAAIEKKFNQIFPEIDQNGKKKKEYEQLKSAQDNNKVQMIEYLITALCDNYKSAFLADLNNHIIQLYNKKLDEAKKGQGYKKKNKQQSGAFFNAKKDDDDFDEI